MILRAACLFFLALFPAHLGGSSATLSFSHLTAENGLPGPIVKGVAQDDRGFVWFATTNGVVRYDGYEGRVYRADNPADGLSSDMTYDLAVDGQGNLWVATHNGLNRYRPELDRFEMLTLPPAEGISPTMQNRYYYGLAVAPDGTPYFATEGGILSTFDFAREELVPLLDAPLKYEIKAAFCDRDGRLWLGTQNHGVVRVDPATRTVVYFDSAETLESVRGEVWAIEEVGEHLWLGTLGHGLVRFDRSTGRGEPVVLEGFEGRNFTRIRRGRDHTVWLATASGLLRYELVDNSFTRYTRNAVLGNSLGSDTVWDILVDQQDNVWVAHDRGVSFARQADFFTAFTELGHGIRPPVNAFLIDEHGRYWMGGDETLMIFDPESGRIEKTYGKETSPEIFEGLNILAAYQTSKGDKFFGSYTKGLIRYLPESDSFKEYRHDPERPDQTLAGRDVRSMAEDAAGHLWVICHGHGFSRFDPETESFTTFTVSEEDATSMAGLWIFDIDVDRDGTLWLSHPRGISRCDPATMVFEHFSHNAGDPTTLSSNDAEGGIHIDRFGNVWVSTLDGLNVMQRSDGSFLRITTEDGLADDKTTAVMSDGEDHIWVAHSRGLSRIEPVYNEDFSVRGVGRIRNYGKGEGTGSNSFCVRAVQRDDRGRLIFGGKESLTVFDPAQIVDNTQPPEVFLTGLEILGQSVAIDPLAKAGRDRFVLSRHIDFLDELELLPNENVVSFRFAALNFIHPEKNRYAYRLDGLDEDWIDAGTEREATYANLAPGRYTFRVKASNNDGYWNESEKTIDVVVASLWWQQPLVWTAVGVLLLVLPGWMVLQGRNDRRRTETELRATIAACRSEIAALQEDLAEKERRLARPRES